MNEQSKKRLFIALNLPQNIKDQVSDLINKLAKQNSGAFIKWVKPKGLHLTLHFLGYLDKNQAEQVKLIMQSLGGKFGELQFSLGKVSAFPNLINPRVIFLECNQVNSKSVFKLQELLGEKLIKLGIAIDKRPWKPHLTLGRVKGKCNLKITDYKFKTKEFSVKNFDLMQSRLTPKGAEYKRIINYRL